MGLPPLLVQTLGSLAAILALAGLAYWMKLGGTPSLKDERTLRDAANEVCDGYEPLSFAISEAGDAALTRDAQGRILVIRRHGNRFAGRLLGGNAAAAFIADRIEVDCGEARFGKVTLAIGDADAWARAINRLGLARHA